MGSFITTLPEDKSLDSTSIFTQAIKFSTEDREDDQEEENLSSSDDDETEPLGDIPSVGEEETQAGSDDEGWAQVDDPFRRSLRAKRQFGDIIGGITGSIGGADQGAEDKQPTEEQLEDWENWSPPDEPEPTWDETPAINDELDETAPSASQDDQVNNDEQPSDQDQPSDEGSESPSDQNDQPTEDQNDGSQNEGSDDSNNAPIISNPSSGGSVVVTYSAPITYSVKKTGYYCIGKQRGHSTS